MATPLALASGPLERAGVFDADSMDVDHARLDIGVYGKLLDLQNIDWGTDAVGDIAM